MILRYTHGFHFLVRMLWIPLIIVVFFSGVLLAVALDLSFQPWMVPLWILVTAIVVIVIDQAVLGPVSSWLYLRVSRRTPVTWAHARAYSPLLTGFEWHPMTELDALEPDRRLSHLEATYGRPRPRRGRGQATGAGFPPEGRG